jgi:hypothetical protein
MRARTIITVIAQFTIYLLFCVPCEINRAMSTTCARLLKICLRRHTKPSIGLPLGLPIKRLYIGSLVVSESEGRFLFTDVVEQVVAWMCCESVLLMLPMTVDCCYGVLAPVILL